MFEEEKKEKIRELILPFLETQRVELVEMDLQPRGRSLLLRFLVEKQGGITLEDCVFLNEEIGTILDHHPEVINEPYILEVSSPGLDRPLTSERDFVRNLGKTVRIILKELWEGKQEYKGEIYDVFPDKLLLKISSEKILPLPLEKIERGEIVF
ncbi:MAG: ribosome maturation factor RimP [Candidatus Omnitrophica bacterium]|nr:ribosome maturation factor RimP [Candidatus Omnitrophota bacterium]MCM8798390.1 ribosome maturation factor RimP [Candidatus Omnitrophota bacterium]